MTLNLTLTVEWATMAGSTVAVWTQPPVVTRVRGGIPRHHTLTWYRRSGGTFRSTAVICQPSTTSVGTLRVFQEIWNCPSASPPMKMSRGSHVKHPSVLLTVRDVMSNILHEYNGCYLETVNLSCRLRLLKKCLICMFFTALNDVCTPIDVCYLCEHGTCVLDSDVHFRCDCSDGYEGSNCGTPVDNCRPNPCMNDAICTSGSGNYTCECVDGWTGGSQ